MTASIKPVLSKDEKIAKLNLQITTLQAKLFDVENDVVRASTAKAAVLLPYVGDTVAFTSGRKTAHTEPVIRTGVVVAIKESVETEGGKRTPVQIKIQHGEGFDAEFSVVYPAQLTSVPVEVEQDNSEDNFPN